MPRFAALLVGMLVAASCQPCMAQTATPNLLNAAFGQITDLSADLTSRQNSCSFTGVVPVTYSLMATGTGPGLSFALTNGTSSLPYEVQWAQSANATSGTNVVAGQALPNQQTQGLLSGLTCALGFTNATLIVLVRATSLQQATAGLYAGALTVILSVQ